MNTAEELAAIMQRAGKPGWEISRALKAANEYGLLEAVLLDEDKPQAPEELRRDYVWLDPGRKVDQAAAEAARKELDRVSRGKREPTYYELAKARYRQRHSESAAVAPVPSARVECRKCRYLVGTLGHKNSCG